MGTSILGFDLGGTKVSAAVFDADGKIIGRGRDKTKAWRDSDEVFETVVRVGNEALAGAGVEASHLSAIGIGSPGPLDPDTGYIIHSANLGFENFPLGPKLSERFGCSVVVSNDVSAGVYGEFKAGAARGATDAFGIFVGTGIGGGIIVGGRLYNGFSKNAGEIGHMIIKAGGPRCGCGNRGCLEALASRKAMTRDIAKAIKRGSKTKLKKLLGKNMSAIPSSALKEAYDAGDKVTVEVVRRAAKYIGIGIGSLVNVLGPQVVILGGGVIEALGNDIIERIDASARAVAFEVAAKDMKIVQAELGDDAGVTGAALLAGEALHRRAAHP
jgi:glucokinase